MSTRPSPDVYFMSIAHEASKRATCPRRHVGCVLVRDGAPLATGYNGAARGLPHCEDIGCGMVDGHCETTVHAEANAIAAAARHGARTEGATAYVTAFPCSRCFHLLINAGIVRIVYGSPYVDRAGDIVRPEAAALGLPLDELLGIVPEALEKTPERVTTEDKNRWRFRAHNKAGERFFWHFTTQEEANSFVRLDNKSVHELPGEFDGGRVLPPTKRRHRHKPPVTKEHE